MRRSPATIACPNFRLSYRDVLVRVVAFLRQLSGPRRHLTAAPSRLVQCGRCGSDFVSSVAWHEQGVTTVQLGWGASPTRWCIRLRCGQCGDVREVDVSDADARRFKRDFELGVADVAAAVVCIERDGVEALMAALQVH